MDDMIMVNLGGSILQTSQLFYLKKGVWYMYLKHFFGGLKLKTLLYITKSFLEFLTIKNDTYGFSQNGTYGFSQIQVEDNFFPILESLNKKKRRSKHQIQVLTIVGSENYIAFSFQVPLIEKRNGGPFKHQFKVGVRPDYMLYDNQPMNCLHPHFGNIVGGLSSGSFIQNAEVHKISKEVYLDKDDVLNFVQFAEVLQVIILKPSRN